MIQKYGHDEGIQHLVDLDKNIEGYTKSCSDPSKNVGTGECVVAQMGTPQEIYYYPVNEFVADFIGEANFIKGTFLSQNGDEAELNVESHEMRVSAMENGKEYTAVVRPESARLADEGGIPCEVTLSCFMGSYQNYQVIEGNTLVKLTDTNPKNKKIIMWAINAHL